MCFIRIPFLLKGCKTIFLPSILQNYFSLIIENIFTTMKIDEHERNALILDFGGVIYQISYLQQKETFKSLGIENFDVLFSQAGQSTFFADFECGKISGKLFREVLSSMMRKNISPEEIDRAWNSILVGFDKDTVRFIEKLSRHYTLFLLSNTNVIHYEIFINEFAGRFGYDFNSLFEKTFWSFKVGMRKPNADIYRMVSQEIGAYADRAVFIDDTGINVIAATESGIRSVLLYPGKMLNDLFDEKLKLKV